MSRVPWRIATALASGAVFGFGLSLSGMLNPARVQGFLDIFGSWDPSLAFVLGGAASVAFVGVRIMNRLRHPILDDRFHLPTERKIDAPLILGSGLFGIGWGLGGFCPGPAIAALCTGMTGPLIFVAAMLVGMQVHDRLLGRGA